MNKYSWIIIFLVLALFSQIKEINRLNGELWTKRAVIDTLESQVEDCRIEEFIDWDSEINEMPKEMEGESL